MLDNVLLKIEKMTPFLHTFHNYVQCLEIVKLGGEEQFFAAS